jgi:O-antigen/teichoic acid export membrane protein
MVMRDLMSAARSGHAAYGLIFMGLQADVLIFGILGGPAAAAEFVLVWKVAEVLVLLLWRLSESLLPELIHADAKNDRDRLVRIYRRGIVLLRLVCLALGCLYGIVGQSLVNLWLGSAAAPQSALAFALAGGAIFWLGSARLPALFAYALGGVNGLAKVACVELFMKLVLIWLLYDKMGFLAPLVAINAVHFCGLAYAYARLSKHTVFGR